MTTNAAPAEKTGSTLTPYLTVRDGARAIEYYKQVFGAVETFRLAGPDGRIGHAELKIAEATIMLSDEHPELDVLGPESRGGSTIGIHILVEDADRVFNAAVAGGAKAIRPVADQFYGERSGKLSDPFGHVWFIGSRVEDISSDEMVRRASELMKTSG